MTEEQPSDALPTLPDLSAREHPQLPDPSASAALPDEAGDRARRRARSTIIAVVLSTVVVLGVVALILSQTVLRGISGSDPVATPQGGQRTGQGSGEYVPDPNDPELAPPPPLFTEKPTVACSLPAQADPPPRTRPDRVRGGNLEYTRPASWTFPWAKGALPYMTQVDAQARNVEGNWYSVVNVGRVAWPKEEGPFPGLEKTAVAIFQCYATTAGVLSHFGEHPTVTDYRTESTTVDGHDAWIVQATYHFEDPEVLSTTSASVVTSIVVDTEDGPMALASDVAADHEDHVRDLDEIIASLRVVS